MGFWVAFLKPIFFQLINSNSMHLSVLCDISTHIYSAQDLRMSSGSMTSGICHCCVQDHLVFSTSYFKIFVFSYIYPTVLENIRSYIFLSNCTPESLTTTPFLIPFHPHPLQALFLPEDQLSASTHKLGQARSVCL